MNTTVDLDRIKYLNEYQIDRIRPMNTTVGIDRKELMNTTVEVDRIRYVNTTVEIE